MSKITVVLNCDEEGNTSISSDVEVTDRELIAVASTVMFYVFDRNESLDPISLSKDIGDRYINYKKIGISLLKKEQE